MPKREVGGWLVIGGVIVALVTSFVAVTGGTDAMDTGSLGHLLMVASSALLGVGVALISIAGPTFGGRLARWGLGTLAFGLIGFSVFFGLLIFPVFEGYGIILLYIPFMVFGGANVIGAGLTVLALVAAGGRPRVVGAAFLAAVAALAGNLILSDSAQNDGQGPLAIAFAIVAGGALLLAFVGLAVLAIDGLRSPRPSP